MKSWSFTTPRRERRQFGLALAGGLWWLMIGHALAQAPGDTQSPVCVDARIGSARSYNCLNLELQKQAVQQHQGQGPVDVVLNAASSATAVGTFNQAAVAEHLGSNFGKSAIPQRPSPVFGSPLIGGR